MDNELTCPACHEATDQTLTHEDMYTCFCGCTAVVHCVDTPEDTVWYFVTPVALLAFAA